MRTDQLTSSSVSNNYLPFDSPRLPSDVGFGKYSDFQARYAQIAAKVFAKSESTISHSEFIRFIELSSFYHFSSHSMTNLLKLLSTGRSDYIFIRRSVDSEEESTLQTSYGLKLVINNTNSIFIQLADNMEKSTFVDDIQYVYRIFPDYQTSFLWYKTSWPQNPPGEYDVEEETLKQRYPGWYETYQTWVCQYEEQFKKQQCDLGYDGEVFPDIFDRVIWELEGFLLSCWLSLQQDVHAVEYTPASWYINWRKASWI